MSQARKSYMLFESDFYNTIVVQNASRNALVYLSIKNMGNSKRKGKRKGRKAKGQILLIYIRDKIHYEPSSQKRIVMLNAKTSLARNFISQQCISEKTPDPVFPPNDVHESVVIKVSAVRFNARVPPELLQSKIPGGGSAV
jgi:hypothetical protein